LELPIWFFDHLFTIQSNFNSFSAVKRLGTPVAILVGICHWEKQKMIRNTLIAFYILAVLAISAVARAESEISVNIFEPKRPVRPVFNPYIVDPLPKFGNPGRGVMTMLSIGNRGAKK
jgi:multisubunit Na+/H+ antiporter MnhE subunit